MFSGCEPNMVQGWGYGIARVRVSRADLFFVTAAELAPRVPPFTLFTTPEPSFGC